MSRTLVVGDVHSCADELRALVEMAAPTRLILAGDVFNKGPKPVETWALVQRWDAESVLGNHDLVVISAHDENPGELAPEPAVEWLRTLPLTIQGPGWVVVHGGIDPRKGVSGTSRTQAVSMRRWPTEDELNPFWWNEYRGDELVLYGHDAVRGLQDHRPRTLGLDTGCVYGGQLTGYLVEDERLLSVPAQRAYRPV